MFLLSFVSVFLTILYSYLFSCDKIENKKNLRPERIGVCGPQQTGKPKQFQRLKPQTVPNHPNPSRHKTNHNIPDSLAFN